MSRLNVQTAATAAEELSSSILEISRQVSEPSKITKQEVNKKIAAGTDVSAKAGVAAVEMNTTSTDLAHQAESLHMEVDRFLAKVQAAESAFPARHFAIRVQSVTSD